jgi:hypothetical protein
MIRNVLEVLNINEKIINEKDNDKNYDILLVNVIAGGNKFWECYVGVPKGNKFYSRYDFIDHHYRKFKTIEMEAFKKFGSENRSLRNIKYSSLNDLNDDIEYNKNIMNMSILEGAWLSFARSGKAYDFLNDDYFYYSTAFHYNGYFNFKENECKNAAEIKAERIYNVIKNLQDSFPEIIETTDEEVLDFVKNYYRDKNVYFLSSNEFVKINDFYLIPYEYDYYNNCKVFQINNTSTMINGNFQFYINNKYNTNLLIESDSPVESICTLIEKSYAGPAVIKLIEDLIEPYLKKTYWYKVIEKLKIRKLNKHERNNLKFLLKYVENKKEESCIK